MNFIEAKELQNLLSDKTVDLCLIDVRQPEEFREGHVPSACNIPLGEIRDKAGNLDKNTKIVLYCASGGRAARAALFLEQAGFTDLLVCPDSWEVIASGDERLAKPAYCRWTPESKKLMTED